MTVDFWSWIAEPDLVVPPWCWSSTTSVIFFGATNNFGLGIYNVIATPFPRIVTSFSVTNNVFFCYKKRIFPVTQGNFDTFFLSARPVKCYMFFKLFWLVTRLHPISPKVRKFEGSRVRRFFSPKVRKLEKKGSGVRTKRFCSPKVQNSEIMKYAIFVVINTRS